MILPPERTPAPEPPIPVYSAACRSEPGELPEYTHPPNMPPPEDALDHAQWAANAAIIYARVLRTYAAELRADRALCAQETRANAAARDAWLDELALIADGGEDE